MTALNFDDINREIELGYINSQLHPVHRLRILNYSQRAQFDNRWNDATLQCRGLIIDDNNNVVARPFRKFFNYDQLESIPNEPFAAYEKMDGSLGILYHVDGKPHIATRGSFTSEQSQRASAMLASKYADAKFDPEYTYLFEIIYPENRIVVDYGDREELVLLAIIETATGREWPLHAYDSVFPVVKRYDGIDDFDSILQIQDPSREGFVIRFQSGLRVKIKFDEYKRLHKLLTGINSRHIWDCLRSGTCLNSMLERVPDEYYQWVKETENDLRAEFAAIEMNARHRMRFGGTRKDLANYFLGCPYPGIMFSMLDGKPYADAIWKMIRPSGQVVFKCEMETINAASPYAEEGKTK